MCHVARPAGLEPAAVRVEAECSNPTELWAHTGDSARGTLCRENGQASSTGTNPAQMRGNLGEVLRPADLLPLIIARYRDPEARCDFHLVRVEVITGLRVGTVDADDIDRFLVDIDLMHTVSVGP